MISKNGEMLAAFRNVKQKWNIKFASDSTFKYKLHTICGNFLIGTPQGKNDKLVLIEMIEINKQQKMITELVLDKKV